MSANTNTTKIDRYPGLLSFERPQSGLFFGRDEEGQELFNLIRLEKVVVLFGKSGLGKSSLLNASTIPLLENHNYFPLRIRFQKAKQADTAFEKEEKKISGSWLDIIAGFFPKKKALISKGYELKDIPEDANTSPLDLVVKTLNTTEGINVNFKVKQNRERNTRLWEEIKDRSYTLPGDSNDIFKEGLVLIFDQFEEFFNYDIIHQKIFLEQLAELIHDTAPARILNSLLKIPIEDRMPVDMAKVTQPNVKVVFAVRSDRLFELHTIKQYIPLVLKNRYELKPLKKKMAKDAIEIPARLSNTGDIQYDSPEFTFGEGIIEALTTALSNEHDEIESSQLQIVCRYFENAIKEKYNKDKHEQLVVNNQMFKGAKQIREILNNFYKDQLKTLGGKERILAARRILEEALIAGGGRASLTAAQMKNFVKNDIKLIDDLQEARLCREEYTHLGKTYEISHDTLIETIEESRKQRQAEEMEKKKRNRSIAVLVIAGVLTLIALAILKRANENYAKSRILKSELLFSKAQDALDKGKHDEAFRYLNAAIYFNKTDSNAANLLKNLNFFELTGEKIILSLDKKTALTITDSTITAIRLDTFPFMPLDTIRNVLVDHIMPSADLRLLACINREDSTLIIRNIHQKKSVSLIGKKIKLKHIVGSGFPRSRFYQLTDKDLFNNIRDWGYFFETSPKRFSQYLQYGDNNRTLAFYDSESIVRFIDTRTGNYIPEYDKITKIDSIKYSKKRAQRYFLYDPIIEVVQLARFNKNILYKIEIKDGYKYVWYNFEKKPADSAEYIIPKLQKISSGGIGRKSEAPFWGKKDSLFILCIEDNSLNKIKIKYKETYNPQKYDDGLLYIENFDSTEIFNVKNTTKRICCAYRYRSRISPKLVAQKNDNTGAAYCILRNEATFTDSTYKSDTMQVIGSIFDASAPLAIPGVFNKDDDLNDDNMFIHNNRLYILFNSDSLRIINLNREGKIFHSPLNVNFDFGAKEGEKIIVSFKYKEKEWQGLISLDKKNDYKTFLNKAYPKLPAEVIRKFNIPD